MLFSELVKSELRGEELNTEVEKLLELKMKNPEIKEIPRIDVINEYLDSSIAEIKGILQNAHEDKTATWDELNEFFLRHLK